MHQQHKLCVRERKGNVIRSYIRRVNTEGNQITLYFIKRSVSIVRHCCFYQIVKSKLLIEQPTIEGCSGSGFRLTVVDRRTLIGDDK